MLTRLLCAALLGGLLLASVPLLAVAQDNKAPADKALIVVKLPTDDAKLTIDGDATKATGQVRRFVTPALKAGSTYSYVFAATWIENGKKQKSEQKVRFKAGQVVEVTFPPPEAPKDKDKGKGDEEAKKEAAYQAAMKKAQTAMKAKKYAEAIKAFGEALKIKPKDTDARAGDAEAAKLLAEQEEAKKKKDEDKKEDEEAKNSKSEVLPPPSVEKEESEVKSRSFEFTYEATVKGLDKSKKAKVWVPVAQSNDDQDVKLLSHAVKAGADKVQGKLTVESEYHNKLFFVETRPDDDGKITVSLSYRVTRREVKGETGKSMKDDAELVQRFLRPDALVPIDGKPLELIKGKQLPDDPMKKARALYDVVNGHMKYDKKGDEWGRGDSAWACDSRFGNCSDFHSLFISLARSQKLPAKFEIGFSIPAKRGEGPVSGYHCWAFFRPEGKAWVPVDISEANKDAKMKEYYFGNLTEDRVTFSTGRDLTLSPKQSGKPVNFLICPYVEADGKPLDAKKHVTTNHSYKDVTK